jgi:hypothetical protein
LLILWLQSMYDQEPTRKSLFTRVAITCGMNHTIFECALTGYSGGVYRQKKEWRSLRSATHHHMEVIMELFAHMQRSGKADFSGQPCIKTKKIVRRYNSCHRHGNINSRNAMPLTTNLQIELFDVWELTTWDHSKIRKIRIHLSGSWLCLQMGWRPAMQICDHKSSIRMFEETIFPRFGTPRLVISGGSHFIDKRFEKYLMNHGIQHNVATPYHPQTSGQEETSNK